MTLTLKIIKAAYRESNMLAIAAEPTTAQTEEGIDALNRIVLGVYGSEVGRQFVDWPVGQIGISAEDQTTWSQNEWAFPPANMRLIAADSSPQTVYLHPQPSDGARMMLIDPAGLLASAPLTIDGNGRRIEGQASYVASTDNLSRTWLYRSDLGNWTVLSRLTGAVDEEFPFPEEFDDYFIIMLAARLNPRYGRALSSESAAAMASTLDKLRGRYAQYTAIAGQPALMNLTVGFGSRYSRALNGDVGHSQRRRMLRPPHYEG